MTREITILPGSSSPNNPPIVPVVPPSSLSGQVKGATIPASPTRNLASLIRGPTAIDRKPIVPPLPLEQPPKKDKEPWGIVDQQIGNTTAQRLSEDGLKPLERSLERKSFIHLQQRWKVSSMAGMKIPPAREPWDDVFRVESKNGNGSIPLPKSSSSAQRKFFQMLFLGVLVMETGILYHRARIARRRSRERVAIQRKEKASAIPR